jgi:hypothetical protein
MSPAWRMCSTFIPKRPIPAAAGRLERYDCEYRRNGEIGVLRGQCLDRRIGERDRLVSEIAAWQKQRNASGARIECKFNTHKARQKLARAYPDTAKESQSLGRGTSRGACVCSETAAKPTAPSQAEIAGNPRPTCSRRASRQPKPPESPTATPPALSTPNALRKETRRRKWRLPIARRDLEASIPMTLNQSSAWSCWKRSKRSSCCCCDVEIRAWVSIPTTSIGYCSVDGLPCAGLNPPICRAHADQRMCSSFCRLAAHQPK